MACYPSPAVLFDLLAIALIVGYWSKLAYLKIAAGVVTGLVAAPFGRHRHSAACRNMHAKTRDSSFSCHCIGA